MFWSFDLPAMPVPLFIAVAQSQCYAQVIILSPSMCMAGGYSNFDIVSYFGFSRLENTFIWLSYILLWLNISENPLFITRETLNP